MSTITKQWLQQKIADMEAARDEIPFGLGEDGTNTLAALRIALASLEAEPAAYSLIFRNMNGVLNDHVNANTTFSTMEQAQAYGKGGNYVRQNDGSLQWVSDPSLDPVVVPLFTAPPSPVSVPDEVTSEYCPAFVKYDITEVDEAWARSFNACRAAMLQGAEPVTTAYKLPELRYLDTVKFNADCALQDPESIYAQEFFLSLDEVFGECGNYTEPVQAKAVSILIAEIFRLRGYPAAPQQEVK